MDAKHICTREFVTCRRDTSVIDAAGQMRDRHVGDLIVVDDAPAGLVPIGMLTDRDIVVAVIAKKLDPAALFAGDIMSAPPALCDERDSLWEIARRMRLHSVRRMPVTGEHGELVGMVTLDDLLAAAAGWIADVAAIPSRQAHFEEKARL